MTTPTTYPYRVNGVVVNMTPAQAARWAARYDVPVEPVEQGTPAAPLGTFERGYPAEAWRPR